MTLSIAKSVNLFRKKFGLAEVNENTLCKALEKQGYTVIYFSKFYNNNDVLRIIQNLKLENQISANNGFTFSNGKFRLVFVNEALSEDEKTLVLAHEAGHIYLGHLNSRNIIGEDVKQEHEANEFAHYLLYPSKKDKTKTWFSRHKKCVIAICLCFLVAVIGIGIFSVISKEKTYYGEYYVTTTGSKYHQKDCIFVKNKTDVRRLTKEEFENGDYEPCQTCLP